MQSVKLDWNYYSNETFSMIAKSICYRKLQAWQGPQKGNILYPVLPIQTGKLLVHLLSGQHLPPSRPYG